MRKALTILTVIALFSSVASAQMFYPTRDNAINKAGGEQYASGATITQCRPSKYRQHFLLMDFDWAAIEAAGAAYAAPVYTFSMVAVNGDDRLGTDNGGNPVRARILISGNNTDWIEGDGNCQFTNFSWTDPVNNAAVTSQFAVTYQDPIDPTTHNAATSTGAWPWGDFDGLRNYSGQYNILPLVWGLGGVRVEVQLLDAFMNQIFSGMDATGNNVVRGIYTFDMDNVGSNGEAYTSDAGTALSPRIEVTPEPASLLLIGFGGVGLLLRKKR